jgi:hypothetical protein
VTVLLALASPELCALALRRPPPDGPEDAVRVILGGTAAMGLDVLCAPWDRRAEVDSVGDELAGGRSSSGDRLHEVDTIAGWLASSPDDRPVVGPVSGPLWLGADVGGDDAQAALDVASDFVADRVRRLSELGVDHVVVFEAGDGGALGGDAAAEAHTPVLRLARHFGVALTLVALDEAVPASALGYDRWVSPSGGTDDLGFLPATSLEDRSPSGGPPAGSLVTEYLLPHVAPARVRAVATSAGRT